MELVTVKPKLLESLTLPGMKEVRVAPLADIQYGAQGCDVERLKRHVSWAMNHGCYFVGVGDYCDVMSPSNRAAWLRANADFYDSFKEAVDDKMEQQRKEIQRILEPTQGRWLGLVRGHHWHKFEDGTETDTRLANYLGCQFLGDAGVIFIGMGPVEARIMLWHGSGSGQTAGAMLNKIENGAKRWNVHVALMAHQHQKPAKADVMMDFGVDAKGNKILTHQNRYYVGAGSFLRGYLVGNKNALGIPTGSYVEKAMMPPVALGAPIIYLRPRKRDGVWMVDLNVSV